jgi:hypothetical protein
LLQHSGGNVSQPSLLTPIDVLTRLLTNPKKFASIHHLVYPPAPQVLVPGNAAAAAEAPPRLSKEDLLQLLPGGVQTECDPPAPTFASLEGAQRNPCRWWRKAHDAHVARARAAEEAGQVQMDRTQ